MVRCTRKNRRGRSREALVTSLKDYGRGNINTNSLYREKVVGLIKEEVQSAAGGSDQKVRRTGVLSLLNYEIAKRLEAGTIRFPEAVDVRELSGAERARFGCDIYYSGSTFVEKVEVERSVRAPGQTFR